MNTTNTTSNVEKELLKPIPVTSPSDNPLLFYIRCLLDLQLKTIRDFLRPQLEKVSNSILDIGAGNSPWRAYLPTDVKYTGLDIAHADEFNMKKSVDIVYYQGGVFPFQDNQFHNALCVEVIEHVADTDLFFKEMFRCLKSNGSVILTVPWSARRHHLPHDYYRFTPEALRKIFLQHGFTEIVINERGNDYSVVFNKIFCLTQGLILPQKKGLLIFTLPIGLILMPIGAFFLLISHVTLLLKIGSKIDPLGYAVTAIKP